LFGPVPFSFSFLGSPPPFYDFFLVFININQLTLFPSFFAACFDPQRSSLGQGNSSSARLFFFRRRKKGLFLGGVDLFVVPFDILRSPCSPLGGQRPCADMSYMPLIWVFVWRSAVFAGSFVESGFMGALFVYYSIREKCLVSSRSVGWTTSFPTPLKRDEWLTY